jgi:carbamoyltransferase
MRRNYIGVASSAHDSALAIVDSDGQVVFAEATERHVQAKRALNIAPDVPLRTAQLVAEYCERGAEIVLAFSWTEGSGRRLRDQFEKMAPTHEYLAELERTIGDVPKAVRRTASAARYFTASQLVAHLSSGATLEYELRECSDWTVNRIERRSYDHHLVHAASGCWTAPFDEAACAIVDGYGEGRACACYSYDHGRIVPVGETESGGVVENAGVAGSLGVFYMNVCDACGFSAVAGEEWKVMGLAPYGEADPKLLSLFREMIWVDGTTMRSPERAKVLDLRRRLDEVKRKAGEPAISAANVAFAGQKVFEERLFEFLNNLYDETRCDSLVLGGGCALNSSANGRIIDSTPFKRVHVTSAPADDGNAIGAALLAFQEDHPAHAWKPTWLTPYLGSRMSQEAKARLKTFSGVEVEECASDAPERAARLLASGKIVGWVQGRAEFGPRALGNRSILADPRSENVRNWINEHVKFREEFRPFAPSVLHEWGDAYFEGYQESAYMERTLRFRPEMARRVPGVVHVDGTGRLQTVKSEWNPRFHRLIHAFFEITDIPLVLNTSFNVMGKPIAHSVEDCVAVFMTSGLDALFIDDLLLAK